MSKEFIHFRQTLNEQIFLRRRILSCFNLLANGLHLGIQFSDVFGKKKVSNPNFKSGIVPYIWTDRGQSDWYVYRPTANDYRALTDAASAYMEVFQQQAQDNTMQQGMMM